MCQFNDSKCDKENYVFIRGISSILSKVPNGKMNEVMNNQQNDFNYIKLKYQIQSQIL